MLYDSSTSNLASNTHIDLIKQYNIFLVSIVPFAAPQNRILFRFFCVSNVTLQIARKKYSNFYTHIPCILCCVWNNRLKWALMHIHFNVYKYMNLCSWCIISTQGVVCVELSRTKQTPILTIFNRSRQCVAWIFRIAVVLCIYV